jgi:hypothetical protein
MWSDLIDGQLARERSADRRAAADSDRRAAELSRRIEPEPPVETEVVCRRMAARAWQVA